MCSCIRFGPRNRLLLCTMNAMPNALKSTHTAHKRWDDTTVFSITLFLRAAAASLKLFLCVPLSVSFSASVSFPFRVLYMCMCVIYRKFVFDFFFSSPVQFSFILDRAPFHIAYIPFILSRMRSHQYSIVYALSLCFTLIFFSALFPFTGFVVISFFRLEFFFLSIAIAVGVSCSRLVNFSCFVKNRHVKRVYVCFDLFSQTILNIETYILLHRLFMCICVALAIRERVWIYTQSKRIFPGFNKLGLDKNSSLFFVCTQDRIVCNRYTRHGTANGSGKKIRINK